jgi:hypothetical protein
MDIKMNLLFAMCVGCALWVFFIYHMKTRSDALKMFKKREEKTYKFLRLRKHQLLWQKMKEERVMRCDVSPK